MEQASGPGYSYDRRTAFGLYQQIVAPAASLLEANGTFSS